VSEIDWCFLDCFCCLIKESIFFFYFLFFLIIFIIFFVGFVQLVFLSVKHLQMHLSAPDEFSSGQNTSKSNILYSIIASLTFKKLIFFLFFIFSPLLCFFCKLELKISKEIIPVKNMGFWLPLHSVLQKSIISGMVFWKQSD